MLGWSELWLQSGARRVLGGLTEQFAPGGLVAMAAMPGLVAVVDQHAAAVRDILTWGVEQSAGVAGVVLLAGYARGLLDEAAARGQRVVVPADTVSWLRADWLSMRLLAVCVLAGSAGAAGSWFGDEDPSLSSIG